MRFLKFAALLQAVPLLVSAAPAPPFEPTSRWVVDYGDQRCTLSRKFETGKRTVQLSFEQTSPRGGISVLLFGSGLGRVQTRRDHQLAIVPLEDVSLHDGIGVVTSKDKESAIYWNNGLPRGKWGLISDTEARRLAKSQPPGRDIPSWVPGYKAKPVKWEDRDWRVDDMSTKESEDREFDERAEKIHAVVLNPRGSRAIALQTGSLRGPLRALEKCAVDSLKDWGIDPAVEAAVATMAHPLKDPARMMTSDDYPSEAISAGTESNLQLWLNIDVTGQISSCRVISTYASPEINDKMCAIVRQRQAFVPARTASGIAVPSYYIESFQFRIES